MLYRWRIRDFRAVLFLCLLSPMIAGAQQGDAYLRDLDKEAHDLSLDRQTRKQGEEEVKNMRSAAGLAEVPSESDTGLAPRLSREQFEEDLRRNFFGSYLFYQKLDRERKDRIYELYKINNDPAKLRKAIQRSLKQQRREK